MMRKSGEKSGIVDTAGRIDQFALTPLTVVDGETP